MKKHRILVLHVFLTLTLVLILTGCSPPGDNTPPVANEDRATTTRNTPVNITVLANDTDADGDALSVTGVTQGSNGTVVSNPNNTVTYTPRANFTGTDTFTYTVSDGHGATATATVTLTVSISPPSGTVLVRGVVLDSPTGGRPVAGVAVRSGSGTLLATTEPDGSFTAEVPLGTSQLILQFSDESQNIHQITVPSESDDVDSVEAFLFADPVAARSPTPGVVVTPTLDNPAGTAEIIEPPDGGIARCLPPPVVCRFEVRGSASPVLGQPGTRFRVFVSVTPVRPSGGGTFPQFPPASVDPRTGAWRMEAQIGSEAFQAQSGNTFQILAIVTDAALTPGTIANPLRFDRPLDIPGVVHISPFADLTVERGEVREVAVLVEPPDSACSNLLVTFRWRIDNRSPNVIYCSNLLTDKGQNPFDGSFEEVFRAGQATALQVPLNPRIYDPATFEWGVRVTACAATGALCEDRDPPCVGRSLRPTFESDIRRLRTNSAAPNCP